MDYREKYEEALERARQIHNEGKAQCFDVMTKVFPELAEVDDGKIRKWLINLVKSHIRWLEDRIKEQLSNGQIYGGELSKAQVSLAWLEKQSKQNLAFVNEHIWLYIVDDVMTWKNGIGQYLDNPEVQEIAKKLCNKYAQKLYNPLSLSNSNNKQESVNKVEPKFKVGDWKGGRMQFLDWLIKEYIDDKEDLRNNKI